MRQESKEIQEYGGQTVQQKTGLIGTLKAKLSPLFSFSSKESEMATSLEDSGFNPETDLQPLCEQLFEKYFEQHIEDMESENPSGTSYRNRAFHLNSYVRIMDGENVTLHDVTYNEDQQSFNAQDLINAVKAKRSYNLETQSKSKLDLRKDSFDYTLEEALKLSGEERVIEALDRAKEEYKKEKESRGDNIYSPLVLFSGTEMEKTIEMPQTAVNGNSVSIMDLVLDGPRLTAEAQKNLNKIRIGWNALCQIPEVIEDSIRFKVERDVIKDVARELILSRYADQVDFSELDPRQQYEIDNRISDYIFRNKPDELFEEQDRKYIHQTQKWLSNKLGYQEDEVSPAYESDDAHSLEHQ